MRGKQPKPAAKPEEAPVSEFVRMRKQLESLDQALLHRCTNTPAEDAPINELVYARFRGLSNRAELAAATARMKVSSQRLAQRAARVADIDADEG